MQRTSIEKHHGTLQVPSGRSAHDDRFDLDETVGFEFVITESTEGSGELVLFPNGIAELIDFDVAGFFRDLISRYGMVVIAIKGFQEGNGERTRGSQSGSGRNVGHRGDFNAFGFEICQDLPKDAMLDLRRIVYNFGLRILQGDGVFVEGFVYGEVDVFANGC